MNNRGIQMKIYLIALSISLIACVSDQSSISISSQEDNKSKIYTFNAYKDFTKLREEFESWEQPLQKENIKDLVRNSEHTLNQAYRLLERKIDVVPSTTEEERKKIRAFNEYLIEMYKLKINQLVMKVIRDI